MSFATITRPSLAYNVTVTTAASTFTFTSVTSVRAVASSTAMGKTKSVPGVLEPAPSKSVKALFPLRKNPVNPEVELVA